MVKNPLANAGRHKRCGFDPWVKIFEVLKEKCVEKIFLEVRRNNHSAKALYEKLGFTYISVREKYYGGVEDALIMSKALSQ